MGREIERKFLVRHEGRRGRVVRSVRIQHEGATASAARAAESRLTHSGAPAPASVHGHVAAQYNGQMRSKAPS